MDCIPMGQVPKLRQLAARHRTLAASAEDPAVREERLRTAALLHREASITESAFVSPATRPLGWGIRPLS